MKVKNIKHLKELTKGKSISLSGISVTPCGNCVIPYTVSISQASAIELYQQIKYSSEESLSASCYMQILVNPLHAFVQIIATNKD